MARRSGGVVMTAVVVVGIVLLAAGLHVAGGDVVAALRALHGR